MVEHGRQPEEDRLPLMTEIVELSPGQVKVLATEVLVVRVKVRGSGRGRLTIEAVGPGGLFASASKSGPDACDWTAGRTAIGWRVVIEPQWWVHESDHRRRLESCHRCPQRERNIPPGFL